MLDLQENLDQSNAVGRESLNEQARLDRDVRRLEQELKTVDLRVLSNTHLPENLQAQVRDLEDSKACQDMELATLTQILKSKECRISGFLSQLGQREAEVSRHQEVIAVKERELAHLRQQATALERRQRVRVEACN
jgi:chromosome segregation ATPase